MLAVAVLGLLAGFLGGYAFTNLATRPVAVDEAFVQWARNAAEPGRAAEMVRHYHGFLHALGVAPDDSKLWRGFGLLVDELRTHELPSDQRSVAAASMRAALHTLAPHRPEAAGWDHALATLTRD